MKHISMRWICLWCLLSVLASTALHAQIAPAWTRQLNPSRWHEISRSVVTTPVQSSLVRLSRQVTTASLIKTNDQNWLRHKVFYSGLFSRQEKDLLLTPAYPKATLGKIIYLYDKHTSFLAQLTTTGNTWHVNPKAFQQHQKILQNLAISLQKYYIEQTPTDFTSIVFSQKEIQHIQESDQPAAYVLSSQELAQFANFSSKHEQQNWTHQKIESTKKEIEQILAKQANLLSEAEYEQYYNAQNRLNYLQLLARTLVNAKQKRLSAVVRYKVALNPGDQKLTDAQRGGKLLWDHTQESEVFKEFSKIYGPYATAEALGAPYEIALQYGPYAPELLGGVQVGKRLRQLEPQACLDELTPKITIIEGLLKQMRLQKPTDPAFYTSFYALHARLEIYQTLAIRARVMINLQR